MYSCLALGSEPDAFLFFHARPHLLGIEQFSALRRGVSLLNFLPYFKRVLGQPAFLLVQQRDGVLHKLIHGLVRPALHVLLDHLFEFRS